MRKPNKKSIADRRKNIILIALLLLFIITTIIFILLWVKARKSHNTPQKSNDPTNTPGKTDEAEITKIDTEALKKDFWGSLYMKADKKLQSRMTMSFSTEVYEKLETRFKDETFLEEAREFLEIGENFGINKIKNEKEKDKVTPFEKYLHLLQITSSLFETLKEYINKIEENAKKFQLQVLTFEEYEFEVMYLVFIKVVINKFLEEKSLVFRVLEKENLLGSVELEKKEMDIYTIMGNLYIVGSSEIGQIIDILGNSANLFTGESVNSRKVNELKNFLLFLSFNIHFMLFWEIRIDSNGDLSVFQNLLKSKINVDNCKEGIKGTFKAISKNLESWTSQELAFYSNTEKLLKIVVKAMET